MYFIYAENLHTRQKIQTHEVSSNFNKKIISQTEQEVCQILISENKDQ